MFKNVLLLVSLSASIAFAYPNKMKVSQGDKYTEVRIKEYKNLHLSESCVKTGEPKCDAFAASNKKSEPSVTKTGVIGHPASRYCHDKLGVIRILISEDKKQYDYCLFKDGSMIDAWDLYYKHFPKEAIK